jgi:hypothetical protein
MCLLYLYRDIAENNSYRVWDAVWRWETSSPRPIWFYEVTIRSAVYSWRQQMIEEGSRFLLWNCQEQ